MLAADPACPSCGPGYLFYATPPQRTNAGMYAGTLPGTADFYQANGLTQPTLQQILHAAARDGAQRNTVAQRTIQAAMAAGTLVLAPTLSGVAAEAAAFGKNPVGYCLSNPAACTVAAEAVACTAAAGACPASSLVPNVGKVVTAAGGAKGGIPHGFASADEFAQFGNNMRAGLGRAGYENAEPILQGSAVTGKSFKTGQPFDVGRVSDFDVGLADPSMLARAKELGIGLRSGGTRTGPLTERDLRALGVFDLSKQMGQQAGREVNFMIYNKPVTAVQRAPSVILPGRK